MRKIFKRISSVFLAFIMAVCIVPIVAFAENTVKFSLNLVSETLTDVVVSVKLDEGAVGAFTFKLVCNDKIEKCTEITIDNDGLFSVENIENYTVAGISAAASKDIPYSNTTDNIAVFTLKKSNKEYIVAEDIKLVFDNCDSIDGEAVSFAVVNNIPAVNNSHYCDFSTVPHYQAEHPHYIAYKCECGNEKVDESVSVKLKSCEICYPKPNISNVSYNQSKDTHKTFTMTVQNRAAMVQFIEPDGGTRTYDRANKNVKIQGYDANGNKVGSMDRKLAYEVWTVESNMSVGVEIKVRAKYLADAIYTWEKTPCTFTVEHFYDGAVRSVTPKAVSGEIGAVETTVVAGPDARAVRFVMEDGSTVTLSAEKATVLPNGDLSFTGNAWMNHRGTNTIKVEVKIQRTWHYAESFTYDAIDSSVRGVKPSAKIGKTGPIETIVVTGPDAQGVRFVMPDGSTATYSAEKATTLANGDLSFSGKAWANKKGENIIKVQIKANGKWQYVAEFTYTAK